MKTIKEKALIIQPKAADVARRVPQGIRHAAALGHEQSGQAEQDREEGKSEDQVSNAAQQSSFYVTDMLTSKFKRIQAKSRNPFQTNQMRSNSVPYAGKSSMPSIQPRQSAFHSRTGSSQMKSAHLLQSQKFTNKSMAKSTQSAIQKFIVSIKTFATSIRSIGTAIAAGGWVAVALIIALAIIGWVLTTPAGIFAGGRYEDDPTRSVYTVLDELAKEVDDKINEIIEDHGDDCEISIHYVDGNENVLEQVGPLVLAVYAVKVNTDPTEPDQIATLDARKEAILRNIFWQAVLIDYKTHENTIVDNGGIENITRYLKIKIELLSVDQLISVLNLNHEQRDVVIWIYELLYETR